MTENKSPLFRIYADQNIYKASLYLQPGFELSTFNDLPNFFHLNKFDALFVRTVTKITKELIENIPKSIKIIGTASAGFDHIDVDALREKGISFYSAAGCNANAVAEYIQINLLWWAFKKQKILEKKTIALVGVGHVGSQVAILCKKMGMKTILYDPPRQKRDDSFISANFKEVLNADIISFHVPLDSTTTHYFREELFNSSYFELVINAARGGIIDESFLLKALKSKQVENCILDCWENEPNFNTELMHKAIVATPHIAGYSEQAKLAATSMIFSQLYSELNYLPLGFIDTNRLSQTTTDSTFTTSSTFLVENPESRAFSTFHNFLEYDYLLRTISKLNKNEQAKRFLLLRTQLPFRNEFRFISIPKPILRDYSILNYLESSID